MCSPHTWTERRLPQRVRTPAHGIKDRRRPHPSIITITKPLPFWMLLRKRRGQGLEAGAAPGAGHDPVAGVVEALQLIAGDAAEARRSRRWR